MNSFSQYATAGRVLLAGRGNAVDVIFIIEKARANQAVECFSVNVFKCWLGVIVGEIVQSDRGTQVMYELRRNQSGHRRRCVAFCGG